METYKKSLSKKKISKNAKNNSDRKQVSALLHSNCCIMNGRTLNPLKIISIAWRKLERLDNQIRKTVF